MKTCKNCERAGKARDIRTGGLEGTLGSLLQRHEAKARAFAQRLAGNSEDAKELVQQASYQALRHWRTYDPVRSFSNWYLTIVRNLFLDSRKARAGGVSLSEPLADDDRCLVEILADGTTGILGQLERKELAEAIRNAIKGLSAKYRAVVRLCDLQDVPYEEAARRLGVPTGTVRSRLFRAHAYLRRNPRLQGLV